MESDTSSMPTIEDDGWVLESGVKLHAEAPQTFEIPDESVRSRLVPTSGAKLVFRMSIEDGMVSVERMWVRVTGYTDTGYVGELLNEPDAGGAPLKVGDRVEFGPEHVIDAIPPPNWNPETGEYEEGRADW